MFDYQEFESLSGLELEKYATQNKDAILDNTFLDYFRANVNRFDDHHLQIALWFLGTIGKTEAYHEIIKYIDYPAKPVRFVALKQITFLKDEDYDTVVLNRAREVIDKNPDVFDYFELRDRLKTLK